MDELAKDEQMRNKMNEDKENTKLTLETTSEQKISLKRQIPDFQRQVDVRQHDLKASTGTIHKLRRQDFTNFLPPPRPLRRQVYYISLCSIIGIWLPPLPPRLPT